MSSQSGLSGFADKLLALSKAAILDTSKPDSFGLLHGAWTNGTQVGPIGHNYSVAQQDQETGVRNFDSRNAKKPLCLLNCVMSGDIFHVTHLFTNKQTGGGGTAAQAGNVTSGLCCSFALTNLRQLTEAVQMYNVIVQNLGLGG